jgi:hypothetical protein
LLNASCITWHLQVYHSGQCCLQAHQPRSHLRCTSLQHSVSGEKRRTSSIFCASTSLTTMLSGTSTSLGRVHAQAANGVCFDYVCLSQSLSDWQR